MTILEAVGTYLQSNNVGTLGTNLFLAVMPEAPDACVAVYETQGVAPLMTMNNTAAWAIDRPGLQVVVRGARGDYPAARDKADQIRALLAKVTDQSLSGINVMRISPSGAVSPVGNDDNQRPMISVNFDCMVRP